MPLVEDKTQVTLPEVEAALAKAETAELWNDWATLKVGTGNLDEAEQGYQRALQLEPDSRLAGVNFALLLLGRGKLGDALPLLRKYQDTLSDEEKAAIRELMNRYRAEQASRPVAWNVPSAVQSVLESAQESQQYVVLVGHDKGALASFASLPGWSSWKGLTIGGGAVGQTQPARTTLQERATTENIAALLTQHAVPADAALLVVDDALSGFHLLCAALRQFKPAVIAVPYNASLGSVEDNVMPYLRTERWDGSSYYGASFRAFCVLAAHFGYHIVACDDQGTSLFLVRADLLQNQTIADAESIFRSGPTRPSDGQKYKYLTSAHYLMDGVSVFASQFGYISYFANDEYIGRHLASGQYWDGSLVETMGRLLCDKSGLGLDIGAHIGTHAVAVTQLVPQISFICFEPQLPLFRLLERNIYENRLGNRIQAAWAAVGHQNCETTLSSTASDGTSAGHDFKYGQGEKVNLGGIQLGAGGQECRMIRLDDLNISELCYVKMDVEGAEPLVLAGMTKTLENNTPVFLYEERDDRHLPEEIFAALHADSAQLSSVSSFLKARGYTVQALGLDWLATPPEQPATTRKNGSSQNAISKRIFQTWKTRTGLPGAFERWSATFKAKNPEFTYELWDDRDNRNFIATEFPWFLATYDSYPAEIYRADAVRYFYLYTFGGFYADLDTECLRPLDSLLHEGDVVFGRMGPNPSFEHSVPNAIMASRPKQEFWLHVIALLMQYARKKGRPEVLTGPVMLKSAVDLYLAGDPLWVKSSIQEISDQLRPDQKPEKRRTDIRILNSRQWYPIDWSDPIHQMLRVQILKGAQLDERSKAELFPESWMVTYWYHSWERLGAS